MAYIKLFYEDKTIELTPDVVAQLTQQIREQVRQMTLDEMVSLLGVMGIPLGKVIKALRELK